ncbi:ABC transporter substrate-binding protein [Pelagicoccus albus]|uniref:ABC transporter substrate-binding protein n=2 Tax=Pelagicoccus albus TaxID=415222 RepID=A0A7X1EA37_9BACT|nr:ABC transporter substrate-binding protein [Pelagicoccus albus]MBC2607956.1 ABC transporter substrate-binding protein [Pelagicoccus albus]
MLPTKFGHFYYISLLLNLLILVGCREGPRSDAPLVLQTNWAPQPEDGGFFHASESGLFEEEGIDVEVRPASAGMNIYSHVAAGEADFGISVLAKLSVAINRGLPLVAVASYRPATLRVLLLHEDDPVQDFPDLNHRMVKARGEDLWLKYLQHEYKLEMRIVPHDFGLGQFLAQDDLIQQGLLTSEPYTLKERGVPVRILELSKAGWENPEVIFCRRDLLEQDPELVAKVVRASLKGWDEFLRGDAEETLAWLAKENPARSIESMRWARDELTKMYGESGVWTGDDFGKISPEKVERILSILKTLGAVGDSLSVEELVDFSIGERI